MRVLRRGMNEAVESAVDQMARQFMKQAMPPKLTPGGHSESCLLIFFCSVVGGFASDLSFSSRLC